MGVDWLLLKSDTGTGTWNRAQLMQLYRISGSIFFLGGGDFSELYLRNIDRVHAYMIIIRSKTFLRYLRNCSVLARFVYILFGYSYYKHQPPHSSLHPAITRSPLGEFFRATRSEKQILAM